MGYPHHDGKVMGSSRHSYEYSYKPRNEILLLEFLLERSPFRII
jgi:hypothetical protein